MDTLISAICVEEITHYELRGRAVHGVHGPTSRIPSLRGNDGLETPSTAMMAAAITGLSRCIRNVNQNLRTVLDIPLLSKRFAGVSTENFKSSDTCTAQPLWIPACAGIVFEITQHPEMSTEPNIFWSRKLCYILQNFTISLQRKNWMAVETRPRRAGNSGSHPPQSSDKSRCTALILAAIDRVAADSIDAAAMSCRTWRALTRAAIMSNWQPRCVEAMTNWRPTRAAIMSN